MERVIPGLIGVVREWLRLYKTTDGKPPNTFGLGERAMDRAYTMKVVRPRAHGPALMNCPPSP